eukprot:755987-Pyramimonas_sp.AAC.1
MHCLPYLCARSAARIAPSVPKASGDAAPSARLATACCSWCSIGYSVSLLVCDWLQCVAPSAQLATLRRS